MPGQFFNLGRYFRRKQQPKDADFNREKKEPKPKAGGEEKVQVTTTTQTTTKEPYSGIGYPKATKTTTTETTAQRNELKAQGKTSPKSSGETPSSSPSATMRKRAGMDILTRLTQRSNKALMVAVSKAKELKTPYVDTEHVLFGLLEDSGIYQLVSELRASPKEIQDHLLKNFKKRDFSGQPKFSPRVKRVLELSLSAARALGYEFISPEHILLSLAQEGEGMAAQALSKFGLTVEVLNKKVTGKTKLEKEEKKKTSAIEQYCDDLTAKAKEGKLDPVVRRSAEIERLIHIISRRTKNNPCLIGDAGVGKTAIVEGLAQRIAAGDVPETLLNKKILQLDLMSLIAGSRHRGEFEERLKNLIKEIKAASGATILFIDELHNVVGAGAGSEGTMDASNILKPSLARGELQTIGTDTVAEYRRYIEKDPALERRFQPIFVREPTKEQAIEMLRALRDKYEAFHKVSIPDETIEAAVRLSARYIGDRFLPDKAVDLIDEAASAVRLPAISLPEEIKSAKERLKRLKEEKKEAEKLGDRVKVSSLEKETQKLQDHLEELNQAYQQKKSTTTNIVSPGVIQEIVSRWTNIPISKLTEKEQDKLLKLEKLVHKRIINQQEAVEAVSEAVRRGRAGLKSTKRPIGSFIFMGPTGVGKTELAKALAEILFGTEEMMVRLDMTEYMEKHEVAKLIGAPPGYVGYEEGGQLTEQVRRHPYSVVLLDEIEKAHPDVFNVLIQILDDGRLTDNKGRTVSFKNTIVICTSNIGTGLIQREMFGLEKLMPRVTAIATFVISPRGRKILTLRDRYWISKEKNKWTTHPLKDYFEGQELKDVKPSDLGKKLPIKGFDTHVIAPSGEETITSGGRVWRRKSTTAKEWETLSLIEMFANHMVVNALPDEPEQQLPTAKLTTHAISPSETQVITFNDRFWRRKNLQSLDWETGTLEDYFKDCYVVIEEEKEEEKEKKDESSNTDPGNRRKYLKEEKKEEKIQEDAEQQLKEAEKIAKEPEQQLPIEKWDVHLFTPQGKEIIIFGDRFWERETSESKKWRTNTLSSLFVRAVVTNADPKNEEEQLPVGQEIGRVREKRRLREDEKFAEMAEKLTEELRKFFRPELLNRFDEIIVFRPLTAEDMLKIVDLQMGTVRKLLEEQNIGLEYSESTKRQLTILGYDPIYGARPLRRTIQRMIENPISSLLIKQEVKGGDVVFVDFDGNDFVFRVKYFEKVKEVKEEIPGRGAFKCLDCNQEFETEVVENATTICPSCASTNLEGGKEEEAKEEIKEKTGEPKEKTKAQVPPKEEGGKEKSPSQAKETFTPPSLEPTISPGEPPASSPSSDTGATLSQSFGEEETPAASPPSVLK